jgi:hypothetical protein
LKREEEAVLPSLFESLGAKLLSIAQRSPFLSCSCPSGEEGQEQEKTSAEGERENS